MKRFVGASVAVAAVLAIVGGLTMTGASAAPAVDVRLVSLSVRNLDTLAPQGGTRSEFRVTLKNFGAQKVFITLKADGGYDYARPNESAACSTGGTTYGGTQSCSWSTGAGAPIVPPRGSVAMTVRTSIEGLETQNPGTLFYQFCINASDAVGHTEHRCMT
jgi:hypothetical protein